MFKFDKSENQAAKDSIVSARTIFQKFEKFDFILTKKNLRGCDVYKKFQFSFDSQNVKNDVIIKKIFPKNEDITFWVGKRGQVGKMLPKKLLKKKMTKFEDLL